MAKKTAWTPTSLAPLGFSLPALLARLQVLSDPHRLGLLFALADGERHVDALCALMGQAQSATSSRLGVLRLARLVEGRREGQRTFYGLTDAGRATVGAVRVVTTSGGRG